MRPDCFYYESHIIIEPVRDERLERFKELCGRLKFRVAKLLMVKGLLTELSRTDSFCTSRSSNYDDIVIRTVALVQKLQEEGYDVWRYKIEATEIDSRYDDAFNLLKHGK